MKKLTAVIVLTIIGLLVVQHAVAKKGGTSVLHVTVTAIMNSSGFDADAAGVIKASHKQQGHSEIQRLAIFASGLDADRTYKLLASDTKHAELVEVADLPTDAAGIIAVKYVKKGQGNGKAGGEPLPAGLDPLGDLRVLEISIGGTQTVLSADVAAAGKLQYLIKRSLVNDGVEETATAALRIKSNGAQDQLRIAARGLTADSLYYLALNEEIAEAYTSTSRGSLNIRGFPAGAPSAFDITDLAILNSSSNSVLSTELP